MGQRLIESVRNLVQIIVEEVGIEVERHCG